MKNLATTTAPCSVIALFVAFAIADDSPVEPAPQPVLLRLAVIDKSGSMGGEQLEVACNELLDLARQLPPSSKYPFLVIPFATNAPSVYRFTNLPDMEQFLSQLRAEGSTNIAAGLKRAVEELDKYRDVQNACVFLYTDGEDSNPEGISEQESKLDALFADRQTRGLQQTVVFCKRWQRANARLVKQLTEHNHARVIDAGELKLVPITLQPRVSVERVEWTSSQQDTLEVSLAASIDVTGDCDANSLAPLVLACTNTGAEGDSRLSVVPGNPQPKSFSIRLPVSAEAILSGDPIELDFQLAEPQTAQIDDALVLPMLALDQLTVPVDMPTTKLRTLIQASLEQPEPSQWVDPLELRAAIPLKLRLDVTTVDNESWQHPVTFRITPDAANSILDGSDTIVLSGPGKYEVEFRVEGRLSNPSESIHTMEFSVGLSVSPIQLPPNVEFEPAQLRLDRTFPPPAPVTTNIFAKVAAQSTPRWVDLMQGLAIVEADVVIRVDGPIRPATELLLRCPPAVQHLQITPAKLASGRQTVRLTLLTTLAPDPESIRLVFRILPPAEQAAVRLVARDPFELEVVAPPPAILVLTDGYRVPSCFRVKLPNSTDCVKLPVVAALTGIDDARAARGLTGSIQASGLVTISTEDLVIPYRHAILPVGLHGQAKPSFFRDTLIEGTISISPPSEAVAVVGSRQTVQVCIPAPFKRLLFYLTLAICSIVALLLTVRLFTRFISSNCPANDPTED